MKNLKIVIMVPIILGALIAYNHWTASRVQPEIKPENLPGIMIGSIPWLPEVTKLRDRLDKLNLPALTEEGTVLHTHEHLDIFINGAHLEPPAGIGVNEAEKFIAPVHTHDLSGIIHVESPEVKKFTLGQFFDIWGLRLNDSCLGGYCAGNGKELKMYINGQRVSGNFRGQEFTAYEEIVLTYGEAKDEPQPIPAKYDFPPGY